MQNKIQNGEKIIDPAEHPEDRYTQEYETLAVEAVAQQDWQTAAKYYRHALKQRVVELALINSCLLYTSDAADEVSPV